ncbi:MAG: hypothetical protein K2X38_25295 [Gemmataceae bacterium]|nr:hypothetical protein [Gemmataceae bacterium]
MNAPLDSIEVLERRLGIVDAELWIVGPPEMSGRLAGPKTRYASTIEVPFYLQKIPNPAAPPGAQRVLIPEPSLWSPETPYLYEAKLDLGGAGKVRFNLGLRRLAWTREDFRVNGATIELKAEQRTTLSEANGLALRQAGINVVFVPVSQSGAWDVADRVGLFVIGEVGRQFDLALRLRRHPSVLGWMIDPRIPSKEALAFKNAAGGFLGLCTSPAEVPPPWIDFVVAAEPQRIRHVQIGRNA